MANNEKIKEVLNVVQKHFVTLIFSDNKLDWFGDKQVKDYKYDLSFVFQLKESKTDEITHKLDIMIKFNEDLNEICTELYTNNDIQENKYIMNKFLSMLMKSLCTVLYDYETDDSCTKRPYNYPVSKAIYSIHTFFNIIPEEQGY